MKKKGFMNFSIGWIFALIAGAVILFLAIYMTTQYMDTQKQSQQAQAGEKLGNWLNSMETSVEEISSTSLSTSVESKIYSRCRDANEFGSQIIRVDEKSVGEWERGMKISSYNKYVFMENPQKGRNFRVISKSLEMPFEVATLNYIIGYDDVYCFKENNIPDNVKEEIEGVSIDNLIVNDTCSDESKEVCFSGDCDISVSVRGNYVEKEGEKFWYYGNGLMYAAIFSDKELYECQLKRLMKRESKLVSLYLSKAEKISSKGCSLGDIVSRLTMLKETSEEISDSEIPVSEKVAGLGSNVENIAEINKGNYGCRLW